MLQCAITHWLTILLCIHKVLGSISNSTMSKNSLNQKVVHMLLSLQLNNKVCRKMAKNQEQHHQQSIASLNVIELWGSQIIQEGHGVQAFIVRGMIVTPYLAQMVQTTNESIAFKCRRVLPKVSNIIVTLNIVRKTLKHK